MSTALSSSKNVIMYIDNIKVAGMQSYNVRCDRNIKKINVIGDQQPNGYARLGRSYEITLKKVYIDNTSLNDGLNLYLNSRDGFTLKLHRKNPSGRETVSTFNNCYVSNLSESCEVNGQTIVEDVTIVSSDEGNKDKSRFKKTMKLGKFIFPLNPTDTEYTLDHDYVIHKYPGLNKGDIEDLGPDCAIITCTGWFYGSNAYNDVRELSEKCRGVGSKSFYHPIYTGIDKVVVKSLSFKHEGGAESATQYTLILIQADPPKVRNAKNKLIRSTKGKSKKKSGKVKSISDIKVGSIVYVSGSYYNKASNGSKVGTLNKKKMTISKISKSSDYPVHIGTKGWVKVSILSWS